MNIKKLQEKIVDFSSKMKYFYIKYKNKKDNDFLFKLYQGNLVDKIKASEECILITGDGKILISPKVFKSPEGREYIVATRKNIYGYWFIYFINKHGKVHAIKLTGNWSNVQFDVYNRNDKHPGSEYDDCYTLPLKYSNFSNLINDLPELNVKFYTCLELNTHYFRKNLSDNKE